MRNLKYILLSVVMFWVTIIFQVNIFSKLSIFGVIPNLYIIYIIYLKVFAQDKVTPKILAILLGLIYDICYGSFVGVHSLVGYIIMNVTDEISNNNVVFETKMGMMTYTFICTFAVELISGIIYLILSAGIFSLFGFVAHIFFCAVYNTILVLFIHPIFSESIKENNNRSVRLLLRY